MFSSGRQAVACILLLLSTAICAQSQSAVDKTQNSSISGKVTLKGKGVSGIVVGLLIRESMRAEITRLRAVTDDEGKYRIANVPAGSYDVIVSAALYIAVSARQSLIVGRNEAVENVDFALHRGGVITGKVTDSEGRPVIEEEVSINAAYGDGSIYINSVRTDDRGVYRAFAIRPGQYTVAAGKGDYEAFGDNYERARYQRTFYTDGPDATKPTVIEVSEGSEATNIDITLTRQLVRYSASGRVIDGQTGQPLANVSYGVQVFIDQNSSSSRTIGAETNKDGEFKLENLSPGKYAVFVDPPADADWGAKPTRFEVLDQDIEGLVVTARKGGSVSGVIVVEGTEDKTVQANLAKGRIYAQVMAQDAGRRSSPSAAINPDGTFQVRGLGPGLLMLWVQLQNSNRVQVVRIERDGAAYPKGLPIKEQDQITGLRVVLTHANGTIRGVVKFETGSPPPGTQFNVSVKRAGEDTTYASYVPVQVDARGQFVASELLPGTYEVSASAGIEVNAPRATQQVVVSNGSVTNVELTLQTSPKRP